MDVVTLQIQKQYTQWPFPEPLADIRIWQAQGGYQQCDLRHDHALIWPERPYNPEVSILIAGCGTKEAAIEAYNNPRATVVGIDLSATSLEHSARLKQKHKLDNLELRQMDLHDVASLGRKFDLIVGFGVLHHLPDPQKGLMALENVLVDDGVMFLTLYGKYLRTGVYMIQEAMRRMAIGQNSDDVTFARNVIHSLPSWHPVHDYMRTASTDDLHFDSGIVDTFLHKQDRAFSVPDVLELAAASGLQFQGWFDNLFYYPDSTMNVDQPLYQKIMALPEHEQWATVELLVPPTSGHCFFLRKKTSDTSKFRIDCDRPDFLKMIPAYRHRLKIEKENDAIKLSREWHSLKISGFDLKLFMSTDGSTTIEEIISKHGDSAERRERACRFFRRMWRLGHFTLEKPFQR